MGWIRNPYDARDWEFSDKAAVVRELPGVISLKHNVPYVLNQRNTGSCVSHAVIAAAMIDEDRHDRVSAPLSTLYAYYNSRRQHSRTRIVRDKGTGIRYCLRGIQKLGCCDDRYWTFSTNPLKVNRQPSFNARIKAHNRRDIKYYAITDTGNGRVEAFQTALTLGCPIVLGTGIAAEFRTLKAPYILDRPKSGDPIIGRHAWVIIGFKKMPNGVVLFEMLNSWGDRWANGGFAWMTDNYVQWSQTRDATVIVRWNENVG